MHVGIFGYANGATFKNITVGTGSITVSGTTGALGGIAGDAANFTTFTNCSNAAMLASSGANSMGGISGRLTNSSITNCQNTGSISAGRYGGGICSYPAQSTIKNSFNGGIVTVEYANGNIVGGGIAGYCKGSQIIACYNTGEVKGISSKSDIALGGICGDNGGVNNTATTYIIACYNTGKVWSDFENATDDNCIYIGGISGYTNRYGVEITACYNTGIVAYTATEEEDELGVGNISGYNTYKSSDSISAPVITACYWADIEYNPTNGIGYKETVSEGAASDEGAIKFADNVWPATTTDTAWGIGNKDGSASGHYWASLGSYNGEYPRLWFE
jgi:hypothetical protein